MAYINKTWYIWSEDIYNNTWQLGLYISQTGDLETNKSSITLQGLLKNVSDSSQEIGNTATFEATVDNIKHSTGKTDIIHIGDLQPNDYIRTFGTLNFNNIEHDMYGEKTITITATMSPSVPNITLSFKTLLNLEKIDASNLVFTELKDIDKEALYTGYTTILTKIIVLPDANHSEELVLTERDAVKSWTLLEERYVPDNGFIGEFVARDLEGELHNITDEFNIEDREIELRFGIVQMGSDEEDLASEEGLIFMTEDDEKIANRLFDDDVITWYSLGNFLITKPEDDEVEDNTSFEAFDYTVKFNKDFDANYKRTITEQSFAEILENHGSVTALWLADYVCSQANVPLATTDFSNANFIINSNQFTEGNSCRDVLKAIAQLAYGWCRIGWDNKLYIDEPILDKNSITKYETIDNDHYYSLTTQKNVYGPINRVIIGMSGIDGEGIYIDDEESVEANGLHELYIYDNPITYTEELRNLALNYGSNLFGLTYKPFETETPGHVWLRANQLIKLVDMESNETYTYPLNLTINYTGHIKTTLAGPAITKQEETLAYNTTIYKTLRNVKIEVDKQSGVITILNSKVQASEDGLSSLETRFNQEITDTYSKQEIQEIVRGIGVDGVVVESVKSTAGVFDNNGLTIEQSIADTKTNINANGMIIYNKTSSVDDPLLTVNSNGVDAKNVKVATYLTIGSHCRIEDYTHTDGTNGCAVFWIGGEF